jgi:transposase
MMCVASACIKMTEEELDALLESTRGAISDENFRKLEAVLGSFLYVSRLVADESMTLRKLREIMLRQKSEKTRKVLERAGLDDTASPEGPLPAGMCSEPPAPGAADKPSGGEQPPKAKGHGRNGANAYPRARTITVPHEALHSGDRCPKCPKGKVYENKQPAILVRIVGQPPLQATLYEQQRLRCNLCGEVFTAKPPAGVGDKKYDPTAGAMVGLLRYGAGLPFYRLENLQQSLGIPLPVATQWDIVEDASQPLEFVFDELGRQAAQGEVFHNDDTFMRILSLMKENETRDPKTERTGIFTTGIVAKTEGRRIALFFTGRKHAGENLLEVLKERASHRKPPLQMCDGLDRNLPKDLEVIVSNCVAHGRRHFVDVFESFPTECRHVLEALRLVYHNDAIARELDPEQRLALHQSESAPVMNELKAWFTAKLENKEVEPNSGLGKAIAYMLKRWERLTQFLRIAGAPIDNNIVERSLKRAILHRKNSLFYKTENGARVGDIFMSLIHTCELNRVDPLDYLTALLQHPEELEERAYAWMPWNYHEALPRAAKPP